MSEPMRVWYCDTADDGEGGCYIAAAERSTARRLALREFFDCDFIDVRARLARSGVAAGRKRGNPLSFTVERPRALTAHEIWDLTGYGVCDGCECWTQLAAYGGLCEDCAPTRALGVLA